MFLALAGAFGTGEIPLWRRLAYWVGLMAFGGLWGAPLARFLWTRPRLEGRPWLQFAIMVVGMSVPYTAVVWLFTGLVAGRRATDVGTALLQMAGLFPFVLMVAAAIGAINLLAAKRLVRTHAAAATDGPPVRFLERLPFKLKGAEIYAVEAEDHYLRVHTSKGSDLILMRLSDAVAELEGLEGAQTHRSWWVARSAVEDIRRADGRATLMLKGGTEAPVSRTHARRLRAAGWY
ncbi:MAG: LytTR family DNA-binding domain-containing protein [Caulobacteraceae bacterium]